MSFEPAFLAASNGAPASAAPVPSSRMSYADATGALVDAAWAAMEAPAPASDPSDAAVTLADPPVPLSGFEDTLPPPENALGGHPSAQPPAVIAPPEPPRIVEPPSDRHGPPLVSAPVSVSAAYQPSSAVAAASHPTGRVDPLGRTMTADAALPAFPLSAVAPNPPLAVAPPAPWSGGSVELPARRYPNPLPYLVSLWRATARRHPNPFAYLVSPQGAPIVLSIAGGLFWMWAAGMTLWLMTMPYHSRHADPGAQAPDPATTAAALSLPSAATTAQGDHARSAPDEPDLAAGSAVAPSGAGPVAAAPHASAFQNGAAIRALDRKWREIAKCRRGSAWGKASTTVTFAGDGSVTRVDVGAPFAGTPTGDCIADALSGARVEPFADKSAVLVYKVYVAPR
jgi:hypothetical protein